MQYLSEPSKSKYVKLRLCGNVVVQQRGNMARTRAALELELAPWKIFARRNDKLIVKILRFSFTSLKAKCKQIFGANKNLYNVYSPAPPSPCSLCCPKAGCYFLSQFFFMAAGKLNSLSKEIGKRAEWQG